MATVVNDRDVQLEATVPRVAGVTLAPNVTIDPANVTGLGIVILASKAVALGATSQFFQIAKTGVVSPASTTVVATVKNLIGTPTLTILPGSGTMSIVPALTLGVFTFTESQMTSDTLTLVLTVVEDGITYSDAMTFVKIREGSDGVNALLSNENVILPADYLGNVTSYIGAAGNFKVYQGANDVTTVCTFSIAPGGNPQGLTYTLDASGPTAGTYAVTGGFPAADTIATLTMRATFGTTFIDKAFTVSKSTAGSPGPRGSLNFQVTLTGTDNVFDTGLASATAALGGGPILLDTVTESNDSMSFAETRFWDGTSWIVVTAVVNGNLLVTGTVGADKIVDNSLTSTQIQANSITAASIATGTLTATEISATAGIYAAQLDTRGLDIKDASGTTIFSYGHALDFSNISNTLGTTLSIDAVTGAGFRAGTATWDSSGTWVSGYGVAMTPGGIRAWDSSGVVKFSLDTATGDAYFAGTLKIGIATDSSTSGYESFSYVNTGVVPDSGFDGTDEILLTKVLQNAPTDVTYNCVINVQSHTQTNCLVWLEPTVNGTVYTPAMKLVWQSDTFNSGTPTSGGPGGVFAFGQNQPWCVTHSGAISYPLGPSGAGTFTFGLIAHVKFLDNSGNLTSISGYTMDVQATVTATQRLA